MKKKISQLPTDLRKTHRGLTPDPVRNKESHLEFNRHKWTILGVIVGSQSSIRVTLFAGIEKEYSTGIYLHTIVNTNTLSQ